MINLYNSKETNFEHNGEVVLSDSISCKVSEELNGQFELELEYSIDKRGKWKYLLEDNIIKTDGQLFRIYHKVKTLKGIKVNARHVFYDLLDNSVKEVDIRGLSCISALNLVMTNLDNPHNFTYVSDISAVNNIYLDDVTGDIINKNPSEVIFNLINLYSGELTRDNFNIGIMNNIGQDRGVLISYGKNIQGIEETLDMDGVATRIKPVGKDSLMLMETFIDSLYINNFSHPKNKVVNFNDISDENELRIAGQKYFLDSKCDIPQFNYKIDFIELTKTEEYKHYAVLERVYLGDTVTVKHSKLNINLKAKVIKITKNILTNRVEKVELGSFKPNLASAINNNIQEVKMDIVQITSDYQKAIDNATQLITGSKGGNVVIRQNPDGKPYEILIMDTTDVMTAQKVWRWNLGGFGYSKTGVNGSFDTAITMDGSIVGKFITALEINGQQIIAGIIKSKNGNWKMDLDSESFNLGDKLVFDGTNLALSGYASFVDLATGGKTVIHGGDIATNTIGALSIKTSELIVGTNIAMGANATISWANVSSKPTLVTSYTQLTNKPTIITSYDQLTNKPYIPSAYSDTQAVNAWVASGYKTYINSNGVYTGSVIASQISAGEISGVTIKTVGNAGNGSYGLILRAQYLDAVDIGGVSRLGIGWESATPFLRLGADDGYDFKISNKGGISTIKSSNNGTNFTGAFNFSGATVTGLDNIPIVVKFL